MWEFHKPERDLEVISVKVHLENFIDHDLVYNWLYDNQRI
jgi:hypothetical protein